MFDNVGKSLDEEATKRSFTSVLIASLLLGGSAAFSVGWGMMVVAEKIQEAYMEDCSNGIDDDGDGLIDMEDPDCALVEVIIDDADLEAAAPPPPPPPPPAAADSSEEEEDDEEEVEDEPDEMVDDQKELEEKVSTEQKSQDRPAGVKDGVEGGVEGGVLGGVKDGVKDGVVGGDLNSGIRAFHHSELEVKKRRQPIYPEAAESMNLGDQRCKVSVTIDEKGVPYKVVVKTCPKVFHESARSAILQWRWYPPKAGKQKVKAQTLISIVFSGR